MAIAALFFSLMSVCVKLAGDRLPASEIVMARGVVTLAMSYAWLKWARVEPWGTNRRLLLLRGALGFCGLFCYYYAVTELPLADATVIQYTNPVLTALLAAFLLAEPIRRRDLVLSLVSLLGVVLVAQPAFLFGANARLPLGTVLVALGGSIASALAYITVRKLRGLEDPLVIVFYFPIVAVPATVPFLVTEAVWPTPSEWLLLLAVGVTTQIAQVYMTRGLHLESAGRATAMTYLQVAFAYAFGLVLFAEMPNGLSLTGALFVMASALVVARRDAPRQAGPPSP
jgi:drug/metabolite transporter (DMT)-like permease